MAYVHQTRRQCDKCNYGMMVRKEHVNVTYWQCLSCGHITYVIPPSLTKIDKDADGNS